jgi:hypothetical protein
MTVTPSSSGFTISQIGGMIGHDTPAAKDHIRRHARHGRARPIDHCSDYKCSHLVTMSGDRWPDDNAPVRPRAAVYLLSLRQARRRPAARLQLEQAARRHDGVSLMQLITHQETKMMRTCIFALAAIVPAFAIDRTGAADGPPAFDIAKNCREEIVAAITTVEACTRDEANAKNDLTKRRSQFGASAKKSCIGEADIGGDKSYVELLTCLVGRDEPRSSSPLRSLAVV